MVRFYKDGNVSNLVMRSDSVENFLESLKTTIESAGIEKVEVLNWNELELKDYPNEVREEIIDTLKVYDKVYVTYEGVEYKISSGFGIRGSYPRDYFICGEYSASEVFTKQERTENFIEKFGYKPPWA